jgi:hypothetical protein
MTTAIISVPDRRGGLNVTQDQTISKDPRVEKFKVAFGEKMEEVARDHAAEIGFDIENESHGLFRAIAMVFSNKALFDEAIRRAKEVANEEPG